MGCTSCGAVIIGDTNLLAIDASLIGLDAEILDPGEVDALLVEILDAFP